MADIILEAPTDTKAVLSVSEPPRGGAEIIIDQPQVARPVARAPERVVPAKRRIVARPSGPPPAPRANEPSSRDLRDAFTAFGNPDKRRFDDESVEDDDDVSERPRGPRGPRARRRAASDASEEEDDSAGEESASGGRSDATGDDDASEYSSGGGGGSSAGRSARPADAYASVEEEKMELLARLERWGAKGKLSVRSDIRDVRYRFKAAKYDRGFSRARIQYQGMLMGAVTTIERVNGAWDPVGAHLDGWSQAVHQDLHNYDPIFEDLFEKYGGKTMLPPEMALMMQLGYSAYSYHLTRAAAQASQPAIEDFLRRNPQFVESMAREAFAQNPGSIGGFQGGFQSQSSQAQAQAQAQAQRAPPPSTSGRHEMRGPDIDLGAMSFLRAPGMDSPRGAGPPPPAATRRMPDPPPQTLHQQQQQIDDDDMMSAVISEDLASVPDMSDDEPQPAPISDETRSVTITATTTGRGRGRGGRGGGGRGRGRGLGAAAAS